MHTDTNPNMNELEKELASVERDALDEERQNAKNNYRILDQELESLVSQIPYPNTTRYTTASNSEDRERLNDEKNANMRYWNKIRDLQEYCDNGSLYSGHVQLNNGQDYYIMDSAFLKSKYLGDTSSTMLINTDDKNYKQIVTAWQYPEQYNTVTISRNISLIKRIVHRVDAKYDASNSLLSNGSDAFLIRALLNNKTQDRIQSIIQTIQQKQNEIRSLPADTSFAVQGCAGSGKTVVLLHRLRYLLYNESIARDQFVLLLPSLTLKAFLADIAREFKIPERNILSYQSYYKFVVGKGNMDNIEEENESVFTEDFLSYVYSKELMRSAYNYLFDLIRQQTSELIQYGDTVINRTLDNEEKQIEDDIAKLKAETFTSALEITAPIVDFIPIKLNSFKTDGTDNLQNFYEEAKTQLDYAKKRYNSIATQSREIVIADDDDRIINNDALMRIVEEIQIQENNTANASPFTVKNHQSKLDKLKQKYTQKAEELKTSLIESEKKQLAEKAKQSAYVFQDVTIESCTVIVERLGALIEKYTYSLQEAEEKRNSIQDIVGNSLSDMIIPLQNLIERSDEICDAAERHVQLLTPTYDYLREYLNLCSTLLASISKHDKEKSNSPRETKDALKLFSKRTDVQAQAYLRLLLFNYCKKQIRDKFDITICKFYKHYWYLELYCHYLTCPQTQNRSTHIFIDECQDLSISEIELIYKLNTHVNEENAKIGQYPVLNVFGDVNQMITQHGIRDWSQLNMISTQYELNENFRNPNQIVDFCNQEFSFFMQKVGVDMEDVNIYDSALDARLENAFCAKNPIFIVKDEYAIKDLQEELALCELSDFTCYTVKDVKGLEFKEVFVITRNMTEKERYISYTRALVKLNVIKNLDFYVDHNEVLYNQGEADDEEETLSES